MRRLLGSALLLLLAPAALAATAGERRLDHRAHAGKAKGTTVREARFIGPRSLRIVVTTQPRRPFKAWGFVYCELPSGKVVTRETRRRARGRIELRVALPKGAGSAADCSVRGGGLNVERDERGRETLARLGRVRMTATLFGSAHPPTVTPTTLALREHAPYPEEWIRVDTVDVEVHGNPPLRRAWTWERCDARGAGCVELPGQTLDEYETTEADVGSRLRARLTATSADGQAVVQSALSEVILPRT